MQHIGRNIVHYAGQFAWLYALTLIPLAQLISIEFTAPIWTALLAVSLPRRDDEHCRRRLAIVLGLVGVVIIVRPGVDAFNIGQLIVLGAAFAFAISFTMVKSLTRTDSVVAIIFWMLVIQSVIGLIPALYVWQWPSAARLAVDRRHRLRRLLRPLLHGARHGACRRDGGDADGLPARAGDGGARLSSLYAESVDMLTICGAALILAGNALNIIGRRATAPAPIPGG